MPLEVGLSREDSRVVGPEPARRRGQRRHRLQLGQTRARDHPHREVPGEDRRDGEPIHDSLTS